jgi:hypothetical protein
MLPAAPPADEVVFATNWFQVVTRQAVGRRAPHCSMRRRD